MVAAAVAPAAGFVIGLAAGYYRGCRRGPHAVGRGPAGVLLSPGCDCSSGPRVEPGLLNALIASRSQYSFRALRCAAAIVVRQSSSSTRRAPSTRANLRVLTREFAALRPLLALVRLDPGVEMAGPSFMCLGGRQANRRRGRCRATAARPRGSASFRCFSAHAAWRSSGV